ncbi:MAG: ABC transporter [Crocinitomicaceae bacterium]|nr:ABC transporter [Crocinitomicaceae bacterium]
MTSSVFLEQVKIALRSIRAQWLRTLLTVTIIGTGIMALMSMITATKALQSSLIEQFIGLGAGTIQISQRNDQGSFKGRRLGQSDPLTFQQAMDLKSALKNVAPTSVSARGTMMGRLARSSEETDPNVLVVGGDEGFLPMSEYDLRTGRNFTAEEVRRNAPLVILGQAAVDKLFSPAENPVDQDIRIRNRRYRVVGVLAEQGASFGMSQDNQAILPVGEIHARFSGRRTSYSIQVKSPDPEQIGPLSELIIGEMRAIRGDLPGSEDSFRLTRSDALIDQFNQGLSSVTYAALFLGLITLLGSSIGLTNIMLVTVTERTGEIGLRKALGASSYTIQTQFLVEVVIIGLLGGIVGILLGIGVGNMVANQLNAPFALPWDWVIVSLCLSGIVSLGSGYYPARRAAQLDPIESLRHA